MRLRTAGTIAMACILLVTAGCKKPAHSSAKLTTIDWKTAGTIEGTIHYTGTPPKPATIDMSQDPVCSMSSGSKLTQQFVVNNGGMANVFVWIKSGLGDKQYPIPATKVVVDQKGCRYVPHVSGIMAGQPIEFTNSDPTMHNVHIVPAVEGNPTENITEAPNAAAQPLIFPKPELMMPVRCNNHPWMEAFINVASNPFYAVSGPDGHFTIRGLPPGTYTLGADQEKLGVKTEQITVTTGKVTRVDFTYSGT